MELGGLVKIFNLKTQSIQISFFIVHQNLTNLLCLQSTSTPSALR